MTVDLLDFKYRGGSFHVSTWTETASIVVWRADLQRDANGDPLEKVVCYHPSDSLIDDAVVLGWQHILDDHLA